MGKLTALVLCLATLGILAAVLTIVTGFLWQKAVSIWTRKREERER